MTGGAGGPGGQRTGRAAALVLFLAYLPYYLNDFVNMTVTDYVAWVWLDYAQRSLAVAVVLYALWRGFISRADAGLVRVPVGPFLAWTVGTAGAAMAYLCLSEFVLAPYFPKGSLGSAPFDPDSPLFRFDLWFGLALVGFSEELVCRGLALTVLRRRFSLPVAAVLSGVLFSLMHWSLSAHTLADAFVYGMIFVPAVLATGSIWPTTVVHFLVNFVLYQM
ncbi:type II CAAX endopeptidase family protein [Pseudodesulfovibrio sp.]|uniref:CPBP family intramembrane glutamic endopeptidase n=1 Tax=Pseudodesulfovibrio sp. TaxID=2035812 RepID=UPI002616348F|nr:type II CAAX endopeptidase family protein [Pseudodesulfovibrio sp.]MDD3313165.1 type II CAAX endopeptidase family protein [Pseudodesulfovibrio sp.]